MVPMRQILPCKGPKEVPISMLKSWSRAMRTGSPGTPSGITTPVTLVMRCAGSPNSSSPMASSPARNARAARRWRAKPASRPSPSTTRAHSRAA